MKRILAAFISISIFVFAVSAVAQSTKVVIPRISLLLFAEIDCNGDRRGTAITNSCGCVGGNTGIDPMATCVTTATGKVWMDRNLGALQVATSLTDTMAYGDLYQWGRGTDGHEKRNSTTTTDQSTTSDPGHGDFIIGSYEWLTPSDPTLWQGVNGTNNPCPSGFRIPTTVEWDAEMSTWIPQDATGAFDSPLKITYGGYRMGNDGGFSEVGSGAVYWTTTVGPSPGVHYIFWLKNSSMNVTNAFDNSSGSAVRCIKD